MRDLVLPDGTQGVDFSRPGITHTRTIDISKCMDIYAHDIKWNLLNPALWCLTLCMALAPHSPICAQAASGREPGNGGGGAQGWVWARSAVPWLSPGWGARAAFPGWDGTWLGVRAWGWWPEPHISLCAPPKTSGKIHLQPSLSLCCLGNAARPAGAPLPSPGL